MAHVRTCMSLRLSTPMHVQRPMCRRLIPPVSLTRRSRRTAPTRSMASGVSKATIPTMAGMVGALSGVFLITMITRAIETRVETLEDDLTMDH